MSNYKTIIQKLEQFIRKYYVNELLKGVIFFVAIGLLYFLLTVGLEYFLWLSSTGRLILFWLFIAVELTLFGRFIIFPLLKLFKISKGINYDEAAQIIGTHFPEVQDKLLNVLQLKKVEKTNHSELLVAGIDQKSAALQPIPFQIAVNLKENVKYLKYAAIPVFIFLLIWVTGKRNLFSESYTRVVNYEQAYEPPAPFSFQIVNSDLNLKEDESFELKVKTEGKVIPENAKIHYNGESYLLKSEAPGEFSYTFDRVKENTKFQFSANKVRSKPYELKVMNVPSLLDFEMQLNYPTYLNKKNKNIQGTGNATIPEGTEVSWNLGTKSTDKIQLKLPDTVLNFNQQQSDFSIQQVVKNNLYYKISTSNKDISDYEELSYQLKVIKDQYPEIKVDMKKDTVNDEMLYFKGQVSDDYGLSKLNLVYYPIDNENELKRRSIPVSSGNFDEFITAFPDTLSLEDGKAYEIYFEVFDNDAVNGAKSAKSATYSFKKLTDDERKDKRLKDQKESIDGMQESLDKMKSSDKDFEEINQLQKENSSLDYNDQKKFEDYLDRLENENQIMKEFTDKYKKDLEDFEEDEDQKSDEEKEALKERLERNEKRLKENEKLMEELKKYQDKIGQDKMSEKLEELSKNKKTQERSLEELLESTKRYYVKKKSQRLGEDLEKLSKEQEKLSEDEENSSEQQKRLNQKFDDWKNKLDELEQENNDLRKPMDLNRDSGKEQDIDQEQSEATEQLEKNESNSSDNEGDNLDSSEENDENQQNNDNGGDAPQQKQKSAAEKMKQMSQSMAQQMQAGQMEQMEEDVESLRQILSNLIIFSFEQEDLMLDFKEMSKDDPSFSEKLQRQNTLKENFKHVDDSLYALALRNPMIGDKITDQIGDVHFNMNKSLERLAKNEMNTGTSNQHYVLSGANELANFLDDALQNMQMMMDAQGSGEGEGMPQPGEGSGEGEGFQLDDIIEEWEDLDDQMGGEESGEEGESNEGEDQGEETPGSEGEEGEEGEQGEDGESGEEGDQQGGGSLPSEEENSGELYEIYKQQQKLRFKLQDVMDDENMSREAKRLIDEMERNEFELLEEGVTEKTRQMMSRIREQMIRLKNSSYSQGKEEKREATTNKKKYKNDSKANFEEAQNYFNSTEILNRQSLPLQPDFQQIVQEYFKEKTDD